MGLSRRDRLLLLDDPRFLGFERGESLLEFRLPLIGLLAKGLDSVLFLLTLGLAAGQDTLISDFLLLAGGVRIEVLDLLVEVGDALEVVFQISGIPLLRIHEVAEEGGMLACPALLKASPLLVVLELRRSDLPQEAHQAL
ncbi:hypothetical protein D3C86_1870720 [compost metagenome]